MADAYAHCGFCGNIFSVDAPWPRECASCNRITYRNPLPVAVLLQPVDSGLLVVRRAIRPAAGALALPGGFIDFGESWQTACARELYEETGIRVPAENIREFGVRSSEDNMLLIFGLSETLLHASDLPPFSVSRETSERRIISHPVSLAFPLHTEMMAAYFASQTQ